MSDDIDPAVVVSEGIAAMQEKIRRLLELVRVQQEAIRHKLDAEARGDLQYSHEASNSMSHASAAYDSLRAELESR